MTDRTWLAVYTILVKVIVASEPYDAKGAFLLLHAMDAGSEKTEIRGSYEAARRNLVAALEGRGKHLEAARTSMVRIMAELERLRRPKV